MLVLKPDTLEVQMLRKIAAVVALCLPTFAQAEVIEFTCRSPATDVTTDLIFDTETTHVRYGTLPIAEHTVWQGDYIYWTNIDNPMDGGKVTAIAYMFNRTTGQLLYRGVNSSVWEDTQENKKYTGFFRQCSRPF